MLIEGRNAYLTDFGLTKRLGGTQVTMTGDVVGTIHYVAPEQIEGREVTSRSDVYSLGCVLYHCLTGRMPFERDTDVAVIYAHLSEPPPRPSRLLPDLPDGFDDVIAKALDKNPERRFQSCAELMARRARSSSRPGRCRRRSRRGGRAPPAPALEEVRDARRSRVPAGRRRRAHARDRPRRARRARRRARVAAAPARSTRPATRGRTS